MASNIAKKYQRLSPIEHILKRPGMYIGGVDEVVGDVWLLQDDQIVEKTISYSPGLYKIFDELIVNAYDQYVRDKTLKNIKVSVTEDEVVVYNDGIGIDVVMHPKEKIYVPELIFGHLRTSTSFADDKPRITGGIHGLGAKLTAIFSTYFKIEVGDPKHKKSFSQYYKNNLSFRSKPKINSYTEKTGYVRITFKPDLKYFGISEISSDLVNLMKRRVYDMVALTNNINIYLDGKRLPVKGIEQYIKMYSDESYIRLNCNNDRWKVYILKSNGSFKHISFVNGIYTRNGGKHTEYIINKITKALKGYIDSKYKTKIKSSFIRDQFWLFLASVIENPSFSSQSKDEMLTPVSKFGSTCELDDSFIKRVFKKFDMDTILKAQIKFSQTIELKKQDSKKKKTVKGITKLYDANFAGTKRSPECTLILTEGDSAKAMAISGLSAISKGNNIYGVFPLKGKLLNVREATHSQIIENKEFKYIKQILGLTINKKYNNDNISELRYGKILLMMDADVDGSHIKGLFINMLHYYWPSLLKIKGFLQMFITPVVKISKNNKSISFYSLSDYDKWKKTSKGNWDIKYYKGLGTNTSAEAKEYFNNLDTHVIDFEWVDSSDNSILLAFAKARANDRKEWLKRYDKDDILDYTRSLVTYKDFIHKELIHFSNYDNIRSIPSLIDGLKPSQRKVLYSAFKRNLVTDIKVSQFVGYASEHTSYHHGEMSLTNTIIGMAQNFVGSNNVNLLTPKGQFGTRILGGKDHSSSRYIFTKLEQITRFIFHKEDDNLLDYLDDDGFKIEPEYYIPIIPMVLVNGAEGIGTGYRTYIPKYDVRDIIKNIKLKLDGGKFKNMIPHYNNYTGIIQKKDSTTYITKGSYVIEKNSIKITELPITSWTEPYKYYLENVIINKPFVKSVINNSTESTINFMIKINKDKLPDKEELEKLLKLSRVINLSNMYLYDKDRVIKLYRSTTSIMEEFYKLRLHYYELRKEYMLNRLKKEIDILRSKARFIGMVIDKKLVLYNKKKDDIINILKKNKYYIIKDEPIFDYLLKMSFYNMTKEKIQELNKRLKDKNREYNTLKKMTPRKLWENDLDALLDALD